jgi:hypothetical protein
LSNSLRLAAAFAALLLTTTVGVGAFAGDARPPLDQTKKDIVVTCPAHWPETSSPASRLSRSWLLWNYIIDETGELYDDNNFAGEEINEAEDKTFQFSCLYENKRWLTVLFPEGRIKKCDGLQKLPNHKMKYADRCLVVPSKSGAAAQAKTFLADEVNDETEIEGFRLSQTLGETMSSIEKRGMSILAREDEKGEVRRLRLAHEGRNLDILFSNGRVEEIDVFVPTGKAAAKRFNHDILLRFGMRWIYAETQEGGVGEKWTSQDKRIVFEAIKKDWEATKGYRLYRK